MKALITKNYIGFSNFYGSNEQREQHLKFKNWIESNKGNWIEIDKECIFNNQYNTIGGYRIHDTYIDEICDDVRTDKNIFFVAHPKGKDAIKKVDFDDHLKNKRFSSCHDVNDNYYRISRRSTIHFILAENDIYISDGIGYTILKKSRLSDNEKKIVLYCANKIKNL
jgi:hypothetical protein